MTPRQQETLDFITSFIRKEGYSPSYEEIMCGIKANSKSLVHRIVIVLILEGFLVKGVSGSRTLQLPEPKIDKNYLVNEILVLISTTVKVKEAEGKELLVGLRKIFEGVGL